MPSDRVRVFKRLETDAEFCARIRVRSGYPINRTGESLDDYAWTWWLMQRKIVEDMR